MGYKELAQRLNAYSAEHQCHGGITAEAADAIETLLAERDAAVDSLRRIKAQLEGSAKLAIAGFQKMEEEEARNPD